MEIHKSQDNRSRSLAKIEANLQTVDCGEVIYDSAGLREREATHLKQEATHLKQTTSEALT